jgi:hypothetical protein
MTRPTLTAALVPVVLLLSCGGGPDGRPALQPIAGEPVAVVPIPLAPPHGDGLAWSGFGSPARVVVRDEAAWAEAWATLFEGSSAAPTRPVIDFGAELVVVVASGERRSTGYGISVPEAAVDGDSLVVAVRETLPGASCATGQALTRPAAAVRLPRSDRAVTFVEQVAVRDCG